MTERLMVHAWKACVGETLPRVRIPLSPPIPAETNTLSRLAAIRPSLTPPFILRRTPSPQRGRRLARRGSCPSGRPTPLSWASGAACCGLGLRVPMACPASAAYRTSTTVWDSEPTGPPVSACGRPRGPARTALPSDAISRFPEASARRQFELPAEVVE